MKDYYYGLMLLSLTGAAIATYGWRIVRKGAARFERVDAVGGSALLSKGFVEMGYWAMQPMARFCAANGITPNHLTAFSMMLGLGAGVAFAIGHPGFAALAALISALADILDGQVARLTKTGSEAGEVFDASVDRYAEFFVMGGVVVYYRDVLPLMLLSMAAMAACYMVSYATAKAEAMQVPPPKGAMRRHERAAYMVAGGTFASLLAPWINPLPGLPASWPAINCAPLIIAVAVIAVAGNWSAIRRLSVLYRILRDRDRGKGGAR